MFKKRSLSTQINLSFLGIMIFTFVSTMIVGILFLVLAQYVAYPANYYDRQIPKIVDYVNNHTDDLLEGNGLKEFEEQFDLDKVTYQFVNFETENQANFILKLNTSESDEDGNYTRYTPLLDSNGMLKGCFIFTYPLRLMPMADRQIVYFVMIIAVFSLPFIFLTGYMWLFGKRLKLNIMIPLKRLMWASKKIENQDLDFKLSYEYNNEFKEVIVSFEQMRKTLKETLTRQWEIEQQQKVLISALAHDLRGPLTVIKGHVELLQDGAYENEERCLKYLNILEGATDRSIDLVEDLNLLFQLEQTDFLLKSEHVNVVNYFSAELSTYEMVCMKHELQLKSDLTQLDDKITMSCDRAQLSRVLDNILMNACRYAPASSTLYVKIYEENSFIVCEVKDQGLGFSEEDLRYGFEKFYRGDKARSKDGGSGLGLYICQRIMRLHGGKIELSNQEGGRVRLYLPL